MVAAFEWRRTLETAPDLLPGRLLRGIGPPSEEKDFCGVQIDDERLSMVLSPDAPLLTLYEGALHGEGPAWQATHHRVWSDVPNRRLLGWYPDGHVEVLRELISEGDTRSEAAPAPDQSHPRRGNTRQWPRSKRAISNLQSGQR